MEAVIIILSIVVVICMITISVVLYNFMLLLSELNKRQVYVISDILQNIDLSTPHIDSLQPDNQIKLEDVLDEKESNDYFDPHSYEPPTDGEDIA
jgi:hypothetical protein